MSFNFINVSKAIIILMSGTPEYLECLNGQWRRPIVILKNLNNFNHNISTVCLSDEKNLTDYLQCLVNQGKRILIYDSNIADLYHLYIHYKQLEDLLGLKVSFLCSKFNKRYSRYCNEEDYQRLIDTELTLTCCLLPLR